MILVYKLLHQIIVGLTLQLTHVPFRLSLRKITLFVPISFSQWNLMSSFLHHLNLLIVTFTDTNVGVQYSTLPMATLAIRIPVIPQSSPNVDFWCRHRDQNKKRTLKRWKSSRECIKSKDGKICSTKNLIENTTKPIKSDRYLHDLSQN